MDSEDKNKFIELYLKKNFEIAIKWDRVIIESNKKKIGIFTEEDQNISSNWKSVVTEVKIYNNL
ncbi:hypothetical protein BH747_03330 [Enterococcus villorum]|uniref:Uncharacterized protein n=1 Tax=Enterococcus villorum TaxID=112904 RepID=A0A1V8YVV4_9ENTE|nr:hypothetical protein [Enterococcus villorum]OQO71047.1 hypothetical protein BH747_03330 [Enterococcus villorum]OQO76753.1 hypothetical protein BH744_01455 [Enterococcus villorum]